MTIVPPVLYVRLFGVPEFVTLPRTVRTSIQFNAHGVVWTVKKISRSDYSLIGDNGPRARFGDAQQIAEDIGHILETGKLPRSTSSVC